MSNSIRSRLLVGAVRLLNMKSMFTKSADELLESVRAENEKKCQFQLLKDDATFHYTDVPVQNGAYHCLKMELKKKAPVEEEKGEEKPPAPKRAILFFFGGGFVRGCTSKAVNSARSYGEKSGRDVWLPYYPLCTDHCVKESYAMVYDTYKAMVKEYDPKNIALLGFSSGGAMALGLCCHINAMAEGVPMPGLVIAVSPGSVPYSEAEKKRMEELNDLDVMLDQHFMVNVIKGVMVKGDPDVPDYMVHTILGDYSNFPKTHLYYATHEILYAEAEYFEKAFQKYGVDYEMHIKEGLFHCYPSITFYPEGREAEEQITSYLSQ